MQKRYQVIYWNRGYAVRDLDRNDIVFASDSKTEVISQAQRLNQFTPVDGDEATYYKQCRDSAADDPA